MERKEKMTNTKKTGSAKKKASEQKHPSTVAIVVALVIAFILELANLNSLGQLGGYLQYGQFGLFGIMAYIFPIAGFLFVLYLNLRKKQDVKSVVCMVIIFVCLCALAHLISGMAVRDTDIFSTFTESAAELKGGGIIGGLLAIILGSLTGKAGAYIITTLAVIICVIVATEYPLMEKISNFLTGRRENRYRDVDNDYDDHYDPYYDEDPADVKVNRKKEIQRTEERRRELNKKAGSYREQLSRRERIEDLPENNKKAKIYEGTDKDGNYIKIVSVPARKKSKAPDDRADLNRLNNKSQSVRDLSAPGKLKRSDNKTKGLGQGLELYALDANGDEIHEITDLNAKNKRNFNETKAAAEAAASAAEINDTGSGNDAMPKASTPAAPVKSNAQSEGSRTSSYERKEERSTPAVKAESQARPVRGKNAKDGYKYPPLDLLERRKGRAQGGGDDLNSVAEKLELILSTYGVNARVIDAQAGPSVTRYELQPELGTRVSKITSLADDLKLNLAVPDIRIEAPIPGRAAIGIEIPNKTKEVVLMRELLEEPTLISHPSKIAYAAGKDISGNVIVSDIAKMPHLLVAGTTGSGKSTFVNTILMTILYRAKPSEVGLIIIDPKKIEFGVYSGIPHLVQDVVTDPAQAVSTLRWAVVEMTNRYQRMQLSGVRDFKSYNAKFDKGQLNPEEENPKRMAQIVIVIDELADLMMVASKEAESLICRLAQLARAAGIHLIIATQRPSVDVVTGLIKANIPARVALLVASGTDSRTIIDANGAEKLLGNGDMLFYPTGYVKPVRVQGAYVSEKEVQDTINYIKDNNDAGYYAEEAEELENYINGTAGSSQSAFLMPGEEQSGNGKYDEFFKEAGMLCIETGKASSSMLQRRFNIGFNRAARIIDQLEEVGAVGPQNGAKPREILVDTLAFEDICNSLG